MGVYDSIWFKNHKGEDCDLQFKNGVRAMLDYKIGDTIPLNNGIYFCHEGCFVVFEHKVVAAFSEDDPQFLFDKWGGQVKYPEL